MERYIFFDDDAKCSTAITTNNTSSTFSSQNDKIQTCNENLNKAKTDYLSMNSPEVLNINVSDTSTMDELYVENSQDNETITDQLNIDLEEHDDEISGGPNNEVEMISENIPRDVVFDSWTEVEMFFEEYGKQNRFTVIKYRVEKNSLGMIHMRTFNCEFEEKYRPNKNQKVKQKNTKTKKVNCQWHVNFSFDDAKTHISITIFVNKHNHVMNFKTQEFGIKYRSLSKDALKEVEIMTRYGNLSITSQRNILKERFPNLQFHDSDLTNSIQKFKGDKHKTNDASNLLNT
ncbi:25124_t:CDS:1, partial [Racocetra persica]